MAVATDSEDVSNLGEVLYKSLRGTARSIIRWLLKCSNVSPPPTRASDLVKVLETTNLTDVVVHPAEHTPFYISMGVFVVVSFVVFYLLMAVYSWASAVWRALLRTTRRQPGDPSHLPVVQPDQIGFEERPNKFKVKMTEPVHVHLVESMKKRSEAAAKPRGSIRETHSARGKVESMVEIPVQTTAPPTTQMPPGSGDKALDRDSLGPASTQSSQSGKGSGGGETSSISTTTASGRTIEIPATTTTSASSGAAEKREAAGRGEYDASPDRSSGACNSSIYLEEITRSPTAAEKKALSLIFGDSEEEESERASVLRRRKQPELQTPPPQQQRRGGWEGVQPLAESTPLRLRERRSSSVRSPTEVSFREPSEFELSLGVRYGAGADSAAAPPSATPSTPPPSTIGSPSSKACSKTSASSLAEGGAGGLATTTTSQENLAQTTIGLLPLSSQCAVRAGCRECQLQPLHVVVLRWSDANSKTVFVTGSFVHWNSKIPMRRDRVGWVVELRLPRGHHEYRFIVDGKWELDRGRLGTIHSAQKGIVNHIVHVN